MNATKAKMEEMVYETPKYPWNEFRCPIYVAPDCKKTGLLKNFSVEESSQLDIDYTIKKLADLIHDPATSDSVPRICRLLYDYLHRVGSDGYKVKHLPEVMNVLEFLATKLKSVEEYEIHFDCMLRVCNLPPLLEITSDRFISSEIMEQYFTTFGYLLLLLPSKRLVHKIHKILYSLLIAAKSKNVASIKKEHCRLAMENSRLPVTVAELLEASFPDVYHNILEIAFVLASVSTISCHKMLEAGILNTVLVRMDLPYATQFRCSRPPDIHLDGEAHSQVTTIMIVNILWCLLTAILPVSKPPDSLMNCLKLTRCAMWGLRYSFKRQICYGQYRKSSLKIRNDIAVLILIGLTTLPSWNLVNCGIADDVILLLAGIQFGDVNILSDNVKFGTSNDELFFYKVLLFIVMRLAENATCIYSMIKRKLMKTILHLVNPTIDSIKIPWSVSQLRNLSAYALKTLSILAPKLPTEFIKYNGTLRLLMLLEWSVNRELDDELVMNCINTICSIVVKGCPLLLENFRKQGLTLPLIKMTNWVLQFEKITPQCQRILTLLLMTTGIIMEKQNFLQEMYAEQNLRIIITLSRRILYQKKTDFEIDGRLWKALGSYIWKCIVWTPTNLQKFILAGGVYIVLDIMEVSDFQTKCLFLGALIDICDNHFCGPYLCTWRGANKKRGIISLLAMIWREEEIKIGVKRLADGSMEDLELPQMGAKQWTETYYTRLLPNISPAIVDTIGSARLKIYSIRKIIERDNDRYKMADERYKILLNDLFLEDRITMSSVDMYFRLKLGQVWNEVSKYLEQVGIAPLGMDGQVMSLMKQRHLSWAMFAKERQRKILISAKNVEETKEKDEHAMIRDSKLAPALDAFDELDFIRRTTERAYMLQRKDEQREEIKSALNFPKGADAEYCNYTFLNKINVTNVFNQSYVACGRSISDENNTETRNLSCDSLNCKNHASVSNTLFTNDNKSNNNTTSCL